MAKNTPEINAGAIDLLNRAAIHLIGETVVDGVAVTAPRPAFDEVGFASRYPRVYIALQGLDRVMRRSDPETQRRILAQMDEAIADMKRLADNYRE